jgi:signal transduction histidine kinase
VDRIADKAVALALCCVAAGAAQAIPAAGAARTADSTALVVGGLAAILISTLAELARRSDWTGAALARVAPVAGCLAVLAWPEALPWLPLLVYDVFASGVPWLAAPAVAWLGVLGRAPGLTVACAAVFSGIVGVLAWRTRRFGAVINSYRDLRDQLAAASQRLRRLNTDLAERQELEVRLATADERSRIAREIHDNAGHLLTRSVLQTQALLVARPELSPEITPVAATLAEAMDTIRQSVHNLRDQAVDTEASLAALGEGTSLRVAVDYQAGTLPPLVGRAFTAIAREAVANTLRHSDARVARIGVVERPGVYQLTVHDDGSAPPAPASGSGMGLATIEERARALGGVFKAGYDAGFTVFVSIPRVDHGLDQQEDL